MNDSQQGKGFFDVTRKIPLALAATEKWQAAVQQLAAIEPILDAHVSQRGLLRISYDASCVGMREIEALLDEAGIARTSGFWWRLKSAWYRFLDDNAKSNAHSGGGACCNRPPFASGGSSDPGKLH